MAITRRGLMVGGSPLLLWPLLDAASVRAQARTSDGPTAVIAQFYGVLEQVMKAGKRTPFPQRFQMLAPAVDAAFDLPGILRVSVGTYWSSLPPSQQSQLLSAFRAFTVASYVANFHSFNGRVLTVAPSTRAVGDRQVVATTIQKPGRSPLRIDYVTRVEAAGWRVVDVLMDGTISRVATQRSDFSAKVSAGDARGLIALLQTKVSKLSGGTMNG